ncbi:probable ribonuclease 11 isoform X2 [Tupaia chinensis]|uniref:probable ribonuclease 11 isoform X2 n=1 Tax=Tupaia chinensis TaxID=246437 RepID=UPI0003C8D2E2|nr:probable ribonuclease 11 isoform X2 [Tupaia chinensis]
MLPVRVTAKITEARNVKGILPLMILMAIIFLLILFWENEMNDEIGPPTIEHLHVDYPQNGHLERYCNHMIIQRVIREPDHACKKKHVFIHERPRKINSICTSPKKMACRNHSSVFCFQSETKFRMTICQLLEGSRYPACRRNCARSEMETFLLLLLGLGLILEGASESIKEFIKEEFTEEARKYDTARSNQGKQTVEVLMSLTLLDKNVSLSTSKNVESSSPLTFRRLHYSVLQENSPGRDKECCNDVLVWRKDSEANGSCKLSNDFIPGSVEVVHRIYKASGCKCERNVGRSCCESPELDTSMFHLTTGKQSPRCQYRSVTSLKKALTVLTGHSLMSWLVSGTKL